VSINTRVRSTTKTVVGDEEIQNQRHRTRHIRQVNDQFDVPTSLTPCPTVWIGRFSSVTVFPFSFRIRLQMSHRFDVFFFNLLVNVFTGKLFVIICMSRRFSSVLMLEDLRYLVMVCRYLGSRMKKSVVLVDVFSVGGGTCLGVFGGCVRTTFFCSSMCFLGGFQVLLWWGASLSGSFVSSILWLLYSLISRILFFLLWLAFLCGLCSLRSLRSVIFCQVLGRRLSCCFVPSEDCLTDRKVP
jgi:hypothetical protein